MKQPGRVFPACCPKEPVSRSLFQKSRSDASSSVQIHLKSSLKLQPPKLGHRSFGLTREVIKYDSVGVALIGKIDTLISHFCQGLDYRSTTRPPYRRRILCTNCRMNLGMVTPSLQMMIPPQFCISPIKIARDTQTATFCVVRIFKADALQITVYAPVSSLYLANVNEYIFWYNIALWFLLYCLPAIFNQRVRWYAPLLDWPSVQWTRRKTIIYK